MAKRRTKDEVLHDKQVEAYFRELEKSPRLLMFRNQVGWLIQAMEGAETGIECADKLKRFAKRILDPMLCNNNCKSMYFCTKPAGHKGVHSEDGLLLWHEDPAVEAAFSKLTKEERTASAEESVAYLDR